MAMISENASALFDKLIEYLPQYKVLICRTCQFAIQPSAISGHLQRHKVFRDKRRALLDIISFLQLSQPDEVHYPEGVPAPIASLPIFSGYICQHDVCSHTCASLKRMQRHWAVTHNRPCHPDQNDYRSASLQTFFMGTKLRYFEVAATSGEPEHDDIEDSGSGTLGVTPATTASSETTSDEPPWIDDLMLMHHYTVSTSSTLNRGSEPDNFWSVVVPQFAYKSEFLMHGLLSISAAHLAFLHPCQSRSYMIASTRHQGLGLPQFRRALETSPDVDNTALALFSRLLVMSQCASLQYGPGMVDADPEKPDQCAAFLHLMRGGCHLSVTRQHIILADSGFQIHRGHSIADTDEILSYDVTVRLENMSHCAVALCGPDEAPAIEASIRELCKAFSASCTTASETCELWIGVELWPTAVNNQYTCLLSQKHPAALVVFAHYLILVHRLANVHWFMSGHAQRLLCLVTSDLGESQRHLISWPLELLGG